MYSLRPSRQLSFIYCKYYNSIFVFRILLGFKGVSKTRKGKRNGVEKNGKRNKGFEGKQNIWISLIPLLTKENDFK